MCGGDDPPLYESISKQSNRYYIRYIPLKRVTSDGIHHLDNTAPKKSRSGCQSLLTLAVTITNTNKRSAAQLSCLSHCYRFNSWAGQISKRLVNNAMFFRQRHGLAVLHADRRSYVTGSIRGWSRSHLTCNEWLLTRRAQAHFAVSLNYH